jgi:hypothetical protein
MRTRVHICIMTCACLIDAGSDASSDASSDDSSSDDSSSDSSSGDELKAVAVKAKATKAREVKAAKRKVIVDCELVESVESFDDDESFSSIVKRFHRVYEPIVNDSVSVYTDENDDGFHICDIKKLYLKDKSFLLQWREKFDELKEEYVLAVGKDTRKPITQKQSLNIIIGKVELVGNLLSPEEKKNIIDLREKYLHP